MAERSRLLRLFSTAVVDQVVLSGASFLVGLLLIRHTSDFDYGLFVLLQSAITLLISAQSAWLSGPVAILAPKKSPDQRKAMIGAVASSQHRFLIKLAAAAVLVVPVGYLAGAWNALLSVVILIGIVAGWAALQREYTRSVLLIYSRPQLMLRADLLYVVVLILGVLLAAFGPWSAIVVAAAALAAAAWIGWAAAHAMLGRDPGWQGGDATAFWREIWPLGIWAAVGAVLHWLFSQSYSTMLATRLDLKAVADVNAARLLLMPTVVLAFGVRNLLTPSAAAWLSESGLRPTLRKLLLFIAGVGVLNLGYMVVLWIFRGWVVTDFLHKNLLDRDRLILLWALISMICLIRDFLMSALLALQQFKPLAWLTGLCAAVSLTVMWLGIGWWGAAGALWGQIAGEAMSFVGVLLLLGRALILDRRPQRAAGGSP